MGDYIDLAFLESFTKIDYSADTDYTDDEVNEFIDLSEQMINERTGRTWGLKTNTSELYDLPKKETLLKNYPVISVTEIVDGDGNTLVNGIDDDYIVDDEFIIWNPNNTLPNRVYITYTSGYNPVRAVVKRLALLLTIQQLTQGGSSSTSNSKSIKVGPITIQKSLGMQTMLNLDSDVDRYWKQIRRLIR